MICGVKFNIKEKRLHGNWGLEIAWDQVLKNGGTFFKKIGMKKCSRKKGTW